MNSSQLNTPDNSNQPSKRIEKLNDTLDTQVRLLLEELEVTGQDFDALIEILKDRMLNSTEPAIVVALARLGELRMDVYKKKIDVLKTVVSDKSTEVASKKKAFSADLDAILSGSVLGAALGAKMGSAAIAPMTPQPLDITPANVFDVEPINYNNSIEPAEVDALLEDTAEETE